MNNAQSWSLDAPSGVYKSHALSSEVLHASMANTIFMPHVQIKQDLQAKKGDTLTFPRFSKNSIQSDYTLDEFDDIPEDLVTQSTVSVTVEEWGRAIPYTRFNAKLSPLDIESELKMELVDNMEYALDKAAADAFKTSLTCYIPTGAAAGSFDTDGTPSSTALSNMNFYHLERLVDYAKGDIFMKPGADGKYKLIASLKAIRGFKLDPLFVQWFSPNNADLKRNGNVGTIEGVDIIECNNQGSSSSNRALRNDLGTGSVLGECIFFGKRPVVAAVVEMPEVQVFKSSFDGRRYSIAWLGIMNFKALWAADSASAGEADVIRVTSA